MVIGPLAVLLTTEQTATASAPDTAPVVAARPRRNASASVCTGPEPYKIAPGIFGS